MKKDNGVNGTVNRLFGIIPIPYYSTADGSFIHFDGYKIINDEVNSDNAVYLSDNIAKFVGVPTSGSEENRTGRGKNSGSEPKPEEVNDRILTVSLSCIPYTDFRENLKKLRDNVSDNPQDSETIEIPEHPTGKLFDGRMGNPGREIAESMYYMIIGGYGLPDRAVSGNPRVEIVGINPRGVFYGIQSLLQLLFIYGGDGDYRLPVGFIFDYPRFAWRGHMIDVCRHFFGIDVIGKLMDAMALFKFNVFRWHLTEDQGWRPEIRAFPKLVEVGSKRKDTQLKHTRSKKFEGKPHGGYYTVEEMKKMVEYGKRRYMEVIPEIEMPGHSTAALAAYPEYSCTGGPFEVAVTFGVKKDVFCPGKEGTFEFLEKILEEIMEIFPSEIIHIGGDEVPKDRWRNCPDCQRRIKEEGLKDEEALQVYFTNRIGKFLKKHGKRLMGWDEILGAGLDKDAIAQYWHGGPERIAGALNEGRQCVMSFNRYTYLNYSYKGLPLHKVYSYGVIPQGTTPEGERYVLGPESPVWTEWIPDEETLFRMVFPRLIAIAEVGWSPLHRRDFSDFVHRLAKIIKMLDVLGIGYNGKVINRYTRKGLIGRLKRFFGKKK